MVTLKAYKVITEFVPTYHIVKSEREFVGETEEEAFYKFYEANRHLRYINGTSIKWADEDTNKRYEEWYNSLSEETQFDMYYKNTTVD